MKIYLLDRKERMCDYWKYYFATEPNVEVVWDDFHSFMKKHNVQCVVSPANAYGLMDGGYDLAITQYFGKGLMKKVQDYIIKNYYGEQPVATSFIIDTGIDDKKLIHTPTMRIPSIIKDYQIVYQAMRTTLMTALENQVESIVIPAFGGSCGGVRPEKLSELMYAAYKQIMNPPTSIDWEYADNYKLRKILE